MAKNYDCDKILMYVEDSAWGALEGMMMQRADMQNAGARAAAMENLKIITKAREAAEIPPVALAARAPYDDAMSGNSYRSRHWVSGHYSRYGDYPETAGNTDRETLSRMMAAADPRERETLERLFMKI